ncbi:radical SAM family heme chaperone HemW [Ruania halotolerans]|uniref:radical SAM family heme chaperone HemW n=1 Tax=Ruania halotolerans TaxID=2897773 RepID=UPI001E5B5F34|nr:radical SAM family heme chaperone HemW [Ruania halotolerans]UFU04942.1 radical SAM family heme chaperone HemW [Ruania halotolerans]
MSPTAAAGMAVEGFLPPSVAEGGDQRDFGIYLHVPFCRVRCGYCDFNTYTSDELGEGASRSDYAATAITEIELAAQALTGAGLPQREVRTVFVGGGTPTLLAPGELASMLEAVERTWGVAPDAEVTTEANPDSVDARDLAALAEAGFTRVSFGMQSVVPEVLATLDRTHDPERVPQVVRWARAAGLSVSLDLIYGAPGETLAQWQRSIDAVVALEPDHVSAYALVVEQGTKMAAQVRRGELPMPDPDDEADKYELAAALLARAGYDWYEISNFARTPSDRCRHNIAYWRSADWWGIGPGAHSHVGGHRWWNVKHPRPYAAQLAGGRLPVAGSETLSRDDREVERILLGVRLADGLEVGRELLARLPDLVADGLIDAQAAAGGRAVLTLRGRLLADTVVRRLT